MIGAILNRKYRVISLIGSGGMAMVYKAVHMSNRRYVAIKVLKEEYKDDREFLRRFSREATAVLNLSHENIVRAYDVGEFNGLPYIVMEYVEGHTLKALIEQNGKLPVRTAIGITCQILDALQAAHSHGIIHRDVKPQNVIVTAKGKAKLTDFGIAREANASTVTFSGHQLLGSVHYISPEQAKGELATESSDLYSVGVSLYEMLTGEVPFSAESTVSVALMHIQQEVLPPLSIDPNIPLSLNDIVLRTLEKDPKRRYDSARAMRNDLVRSLSNPNGTFAKEYNGSPAKPPKKKLSVYLLIGLCVFLPILLVLCIGILYFMQGNDKDKPNADLLVPLFTDSPSPEPTPVATPVPENVVTMPSLLGKDFDEALHSLNEAGIANIQVQFTTQSDEQLDSDTVVTQTPSVSATLLPTSTVKLTVYRKSLGSYKADVSFAPALPKGENLVQIVYSSSNHEDIAYQVVVYERIRQSENAQITEAATVYGYEPVTRNLILLINGQEISSQAVTFTK